MAYVTMLLSKKPKSTSWLMGCFPPFSMCEANPWRNQKAPPDLAHNLGPSQGDGAVLAPVLPLTFLHFCPPPCSSAPTLIWPPPLNHYGSGSLNITGLQRNYTTEAKQINKLWSWTSTRSSLLVPRGCLSWRSATSDLGSLFGEAAKSVHGQATGERVSGDGANTGLRLDRPINSIALTRLASGPTEKREKSVCEGMLNYYLCNGHCW